MKSVVFCVLAGVALVAAGPLAQQPADTFMVFGSGTANCRAWNDRLKDANLHALDLQWVFGFVSAAGVFAGVQLKVDANGIEPFVTTYCQEHPADTITSAAATLVGKLRK
jgi:hypothetical protein